MVWKVNVHEAGSQWVSAPLSMVLEKGLSTGINFHFHELDESPNCYLFRGVCNIEHIKQLVHDPEVFQLEFEGCHEDDSPTEVLIYHSSSRPDPMHWLICEGKNCGWEVWDSKFSPWIEKDIKHELITDVTLRIGVAIFKDAHGSTPNSLIINTRKQEAVFKIKTIADKLNLSIILESEVQEDRLVIAHLPSGGGGETIDEGGEEIPEELFITGRIA